MDVGYSVWVLGIFAIIGIGPCVSGGYSGVDSCVEKQHESRIRRRRGIGELDRRHLTDDLIFFYLFVISGYLGGEGVGQTRRHTKLRFFEREV